MNRARMVLFLLLGLGVLAGCQTKFQASSAEKRTARDVLWTDFDEKEGFGLYSYLLFGSSSPAGRPRRMAAARAYLATFQGVEVQTASPENLNIFYVPLRREAYRKQPLKPGEEGWLVDNYDYVTAKELLLHVREKGDDIYLVSYFLPLTSVAEPDKDKLLVQDLSLVKEDLIELWIVEFEGQVAGERYWDEVTLRGAMLRVRTALPVIGDLVKITGKAFAGEFSE